MSRREKTPFAIGNDGVLCLKQKYCGISPIIVLIDGLPILRFGREATTYMRVDDVIAWHEKELAESNGQSGSLSTLQSLRKAKQMRADGKCQEVAG